MVVTKDALLEPISDATARCSALRESVPVLYMIDSYHGKAAGGEGALVKMTRLLPKDRYRCSVAIFQSEMDPAHMARDFNCAVHFFPLTRIYDWNAIQTALKIRELIHRERIAIVHTFFTTSDLWGGLVAKLSGVPVLISSRRDMGILRTKKHWAAYRFLGGMYDQVQAVSERVRAFTIREDKLNPASVVTIYNGIDLDTITKVRKSDLRAEFPELSMRSPIIASVGNVRRIKGIINLIQAAAVVCRKYPRACFLIIGRIQEEDYFKELERAIENLGLSENVRFLGSRDDIFSILKASDAFCLQSLSEGHSNAVLEAMGCELPCVVSDVGGNSEVIEEGRSGYLVPVGRPDLAGARLIEIFDNPQTAKAMGQRGHQIVESRFTTQTMIKRLVNLYDNLLRKMDPACAA